MQNKHFTVDCGIYPFRLYLFFSEVDFLLDIMKEKITQKPFKKLKKLFRQLKYFVYLYVNEPLADALMGHLKMR